MKLLEEEFKILAPESSCMVTGLLKDQHTNRPGKMLLTTRLISAFIYCIFIFTILLSSYTVFACSLSCLLPIHIWIKPAVCMCHPINLQCKISHASCPQPRTGVITDSPSPLQRPQPTGMVRSSPCWFYVLLLGGVFQTEGTMQLSS